MIYCYEGYGDCRSSKWWFRVYCTFLFLTLRTYHLKTHSPPPQCHANEQDQVNFIRARDKS
ncbi:hypothetical protein Hanom_Chr08g00719651 [Helianthus anomalus]